MGHIMRKKKEKQLERLKGMIKRMQANTTW